MARRSRAPAAELATISAIAPKCSTPKITDSAAAPAAAASVKSQVGAGGRFAISLTHPDCSSQRNAAGVELTDRSHGAGNAVHVHASGAGRHEGGHPSITVRGQNLDTFPIGNDRSAETKELVKPFGRRQGLVRRLPVDMQYARKRENKIGPLQKGVASNRTNSGIIEGGGYRAVRQRLQHKGSPSG
jgi:hypothetical protein